MNSIVLELQKDALDKKVRTSDLLRKGLVVAKKLKIKDFEDWINYELNGYSSNDEIPDYREAQGEVKAWNPYNGYIPIIFKDSQREIMLCKRKTGQSVAELECLVDNIGSNSMFQMPFSAETQRNLAKGCGMDFPFTLFVPSSKLMGMLDIVRNIVLNWTLKLEEEGILGEDFSFTKDEIEKAHTASQNINNFFGEVKQANLQQGNKEAVQVVSIEIDKKQIQTFLKEVKKKLDSVKMDKDEKKELLSDIQSVEVQTKSPKPKDSIIKEGLLSIKSILEKAGGAIVANLLSNFPL